MAEEEQFDLFCTQCGQKLTKDATFCPSCGAQVSEMTEAPSNSGYSNPSYGAPQRDMSGRLKVISIILIITAALFLITGIYFLASVDPVIDAMKNDASWADLVKQAEDSGMTEQDLVNLMKSMLVAIGATSLVCAILVGVAGAFGLMKKCWGLGFAFLIIATVIQFSIVGLIITILWYTTKPAFIKSSA